MATKEKKTSLDDVILNEHKKVDSALATLRANRKYQQDRVEHGSSRVDLYVKNVEGDWLDEWDDESTSNTDDSK